jgi:hypothetical protein
MKKVVRIFILTCGLISSVAWADEKVNVQITRITLDPSTPQTADSFRVEVWTINNGDMSANGVCTVEIVKNGTALVSHGTSQDMPGRHAIKWPSILGLSCSPGAFTLTQPGTYIARVTWSSGSEYRTTKELMFTCTGVDTSIIKSPNPFLRPEQLRQQAEAAQQEQFRNQQAQQEALRQQQLQQQQAEAARLQQIRNQQAQQQQQQQAEATRLQQIRNQQAQQEVLRQQQLRQQQADAARLQQIQNQQAQQERLRRLQAESEQAQQIRRNLEQAERARQLQQQVQKIKNANGWQRVN